MNVPIQFRQLLLDTYTPFFNGGFLDFYSAPSPANGDVAIDGTALFCGSCQFGSPAFQTTNSQGIALGNAMVDATSPVAANLAWARAFASDHVTRLGDLKVGAVGDTSADVTVSSVTVAIGDPIHVVTLRFTFSAPAAPVSSSIRYRMPAGPMPVRKP